MKSFWTKDCETTAQKIERKEHIARANRLFHVLETHLEEELFRVQKKRRNLKSVLTQNYSEYQADRNATERTLLEIIDLLPTEELT
jgi:hypothetical protein